MSSIPLHYRPELHRALYLPGYYRDPFLNPRWQDPFLSNSRYSVHKPTTVVDDPRNTFVDLLCRIRTAVWNALTSLCRWLEDCVRFICNRPRPLDKLLAPYKALPPTSPEFEKKALELAKESLNEEEIEEIDTFMNLPGCVRIVLRAAVFSEYIPLNYSYECQRLRPEFNKLPQSDKIAILKHFDSECKKTENGYILIPKNPERESAPEEMEISEKAGEWWKKLEATAIEAGKGDHPIMKAISKALGHEGVQQAEENGGIPPHYADPFYFDEWRNPDFFDHVDAYPVDDYGGREPFRRTPPPQTGFLRSHLSV